MMSAIVTGAAAPPAPTATRRPRGGLLRAVLHNRKAMVGAALLILFIVLAAFPHLFVPWLHGDPRAIDYRPLAPPRRSPPCPWSPRRASTGWAPPAWARTFTPSSSTAPASRSSSRWSPAP